MKKEDPPKLTVLYYEEFLQGEDMNEHNKDLKVVQRDGRHYFLDIDMPLEKLALVLSDQIIRIYRGVVLKLEIFSHTKKDNKRTCSRIK